MDTNIVSSLGAGSGIDTLNLVKQLTEIERAPKANRLDTKENTLEAQISGYGTLKSSLAAFQDLLGPLADPDTFNARAASFPDTDVITPVSLDANAQIGSYQIEVLSVAQAQSLAGGAVADKDAQLSSTGSMTIQFGEWAYDGNDTPTSFAQNDSRAALTIEVEATDTLQDIADKINEEESGVQANVLQVDGQYQLLLTPPSGASNALQVTVDDASLADFEFNATTQGMTETQQAQDAELKVNGLSVFRDTNDIEDVITGFEFTLNKASPGDKLSFSVTEDKSTAEQAVRDFVEGYNVLLESINALTSSESDESGEDSVAGQLSNDPTTKSILSEIRSVISSTISGIESGYNALTNVGIRTELDGTLAIDEEDFSGAFEDNFDLVASMFSPQVSASSSSIDVSIGTYARNTVPGSYDVNILQAPAKGTLTADAVTDGFPLDASVGNYSFKVSVDGTESEEIVLSGTYATADDLRAELQTLINGDDNIKGAGASVDVSYDGTAFSFESRQYGTSSKVSFTEASSGASSMAGLGIHTSLTGTSGRAVSGTIDGQPGFGSGNVLLPALDSDPYGLNLSVDGSVSGSYTISYSRGFADTMSKLIDRFLASDGVLATKQTTIDNQLNRIDADREKLDERMSKYESRLTSQFLAMERIISSMQATGDSLDGLLDRLPFTANNG